MTRTTIVGLAVAMAAACFAPFASAQEGRACDLHVSGGANIAHPFVRKHFDQTAPIEEPELARYEMSGQRAFLSPVVRALRLDDELLAMLMPSGAALNVIRHGDLKNEKVFKKARSPHFDRMSQCHGELMVYNVYGVFFPKEGHNEAFGVLSPVLAGKNRIHMTFEYHYFEEGAKKPVRIKESVDVPIDLAGIDSRLPLGPETAPALIEATNQALRIFTERHERKLPSQT